MYVRTKGGREEEERYFKEKREIIMEIVRDIRNNE